MISFVAGEIIAKGKNSLVVLLPTGLGYEVKVTPGLFLKQTIGSEIKLFTLFQVRDDSQDLFGVETWEELEFLKLVVSISGVGPKSGLNILALGSLEEIKKAIVQGDLTFLTKVSGIGKKIAERIIVELKEKIKAGQLETGSDLKTGQAHLGDVIEALIGLGYGAAEARSALNKVAGGEEDISKILKAALRELNKKV